MSAAVPAPAHPVERLGFLDAIEGRTACPYGVPEHAELWAKGYDYAFDYGLCTLPRFGAKKRSRR